MDPNRRIDLKLVLFYYVNSFILDFFHFLEKNACFYTSRSFLLQGDKRCSLLQFDMAHVLIFCNVSVVSTSDLYFSSLIAQSFVTSMKVTCRNCLLRNI